MNNQKYLLVELTEIPRFWLTDEMPENSILLGNIEYRDADIGDFIGFYDFLRNSAGEILGVRFFPFEDCDFAEKELKMFVSPNQNYDESKSDDQLFGDNKLFKSKNGRILLTFLAPTEKFASDCQVFYANFVERLPKVA